MWIDSPEERKRPWGWPCGVGVLICIGTIPYIFSVYMFRFDSTDEYEWVLQWDVALGAIFAFGVLLVMSPSMPKWPWRVELFAVMLRAIPAMAAWIAITGGLLSHHYFVHQIRSGVSR